MHVLCLSRIGGNWRRFNSIGEELNMDVPEIYPRGDQVLKYHNNTGRI